MALPENTILENRYRIESLLAHGSLGAVYQAFDIQLNDTVAVKENFFQTTEQITQFRREALMLARLRHPALSQVRQHFSFEGQQYLVMTFIEGSDLWQLIQQKAGPLTEWEALRYLSQVGDAVGYLHRQTPPLAHRDIKPRNIKLTPNGEAILVDFGIARQATPEGSEAGTPGLVSAFAPPEGYLNTPTVDIYGLGATLYSLVTGQRPPHGLSLATGRAKLTPPHDFNPGLGSLTLQAIDQAMQPEPEKRPQNVADWQRMLEAAIEAIANHAVEPARQTPNPARTEIKPAPAKSLPVGSPTQPEAVITQHWLVDSTGAGYPLGVKPLRIGRHAEANIVIEDAAVSPYHASIRVEEQRCVVFDEASGTGSFLNGYRLPAEWYPFQPGDVLVIGPARFYLTTTRPAKLAQPHLTAGEPGDRHEPYTAVERQGQGSTAVAVAGPGQPNLAGPPRPAPDSQEARPRQKPAFPWLVALALVGLLLAAGLGLGGYNWFQARNTMLAEQNLAARRQTQTGEAVLAQTGEASARLTVQAGEQADATRQAEASQQTAERLSAATQAALVSSELTARPSNSPTPNPTQPPTATMTLTPTAVLTRTAAAIATAPAGPTLIPLTSTTAVAQLGSQEVIDVEINPKNPLEVYALVKRDGVYKSSNGGEGPWARLDLDGSSVTGLVIDPTDPRRLYAPTWNAVLKSIDGGNTWDPKTSGLVSNRAVDVLTLHPAMPNILYAGVGETLVVSTDGGESWSSGLYGRGLRVNRLNEIVVDPFDNKTLYVAGVAASVYKSTDGGQSFTALPYNIGEGAFGLAAQPRQKGVYLVGINAAAAGIIKTDNGQDFRPASAGLVYGGADSAYAALVYAPSNPQIVYAGSGYESNPDAKGIFKSVDGGESWQSINEGLRVNLDTGYPYYVKAMAVHPTQPDIVFAATGSGLYQSVDGGRSWKLR